MAAAFVALPLVGVPLASAPAVSAHPLGNFTVNTSANLIVRPDAVLVDHVVDMAEIPAFQERSAIDVDGDRVQTDADLAGYGRARCAGFAPRLALRVDGDDVVLEPAASRAMLLPGQGGLETLRIECRFEASLHPAGGERSIVFEDGTFPGRLGWREVTASGDGATIVAADVPERSPSERLTAYPTDELQAPPAVRTAELRVAPGGGSTAQPVAGAGGRAPFGGTSGPLADVTRLLDRLLTARASSAPFAAAAIVVAVLLGALHALAPGHGKTVVAAYVAAERGRARHAVAIGLTVAVTHTAGVLVLGAVVAASDVGPERAYPWLGVANGLIVVAIGLALLRRARRRSRERVAVHGHGREPGHGSAHARGAGGHGHADHAHEHAGRSGGGRPRALDLVGMGFAGGLVPSPSALVVLLGAAALGRAWLGVGLVLAYGVGMAAVLVGAGALLVWLRDRMDRPRLPLLERAAAVLPTITAVLVIVGGSLVALRAAAGA